MPLNNTNKSDIKAQVEILSDGIKKKTKRDMISYRIEDMDKVFIRYERLRDSLKMEMRITPESNIQIDRHKVGALMLLALIKEDFIKLKTTKSSTDVEKHRNVYLGFLLAKAIIRDFYKIDTQNHEFGVTDINIREQDGYSRWFRRLIMANKNMIDSISKASGNDDMNLVFFISHIFYHMEKNFILATSIDQN